MTSRTLKWQPSHPQVTTFSPQITILLPPHDTPSPSSDNPLMAKWHPSHPQVTILSPPSDSPLTVKWQPSHPQVTTLSLSCTPWHPSMFPQGIPQAPLASQAPSASLRYPQHSTTNPPSSQHSRGNPQHPPGTFSIPQATSASSRHPQYPPPNTPAVSHNIPSPYHTQPTLLQAPPLSSCRILTGFWQSTEETFTWPFCWDIFWDEIWHYKWYKYVIKFHEDWEEILTMKYGTLRWMRIPNINMCVCGGGGKGEGIGYCLKLVSSAVEYGQLWLLWHRLSGKGGKEDLLLPKACTLSCLI